MNTTHNKILQAARLRKRKRLCMAKETWSSF